MAGIFEDLLGAVGAVQTLSTAAQQAPAAADPSNPAGVTAPPVEDRVAALEQFVVTWGPVIEKLAPLIEKL